MTARGAVYRLRLRAFALALRGPRVFRCFDEERAVVDRPYRKQPLPFFV